MSVNSEHGFDHDKNSIPQSVEELKRWDDEDAQDNKMTEGELTASQEFKAREASQPVVVQASSLSPLVQAAMDNRLDVAKLNDMLAVQEKYEAMEAKKAYHKAVAEFKAHAPTIKKDRTVSYGEGKNKTTYKHVGLGYALSEINPALAASGLSLSWKTKQENGQVIVTAYLTHALGHSENTALMAAPDSSGGKNGIQSIASSTTYLKRHTGFALLGLEGIDDDDGQGAGARTPVDGNRQPETKKYVPKYNADQKATFDQIIRDEDAIAVYLLSIAIAEGIWTDLYNSGEKGEKVSLKKSCDDLISVGRTMVKNIETALGNGDAVLAIENYDCSETGEGLLRRHLGGEGIDNLNELIKLDD